MSTRSGARRGSAPRGSSSGAGLLVLGVLVGALAFGIAAGRERAGGQLRMDPPLSVASSGRSLLVYPREEIRLRMNHAHPAHAALSCTRCHADAEASRSSRDRLWPAEASCAPCHDEVDRTRASVERCGRCHVGAFLPASEEGAESIVGRIVIPPSRVVPPRVTFSHATHRTTPGGCERCHAGVRSADIATRAHLPTMRDCLGCHFVAGLVDATRSASSPTPCTACHEALPDGCIRASFGTEGWLNPPQWMAGMHHDHEWLTRHRWVAADSGPLCAACHVERECADCHDGRVRPRRVHPGDYLATHAVMARRDEPRCTSCHVASTFCSECHARLGLATFSAPATRGSGRYHPPQAVWTRGPNLHGVEAQRAMQSCVSCHAEDDCVACHGSGRVGGGGVNPHPPGFAASCATVLAASPAACVRCHGDIAELRTRCR